ncbi:hypothetical protein DTO164E3_7879 [Paecilomyces variotii]|nr:hypothetical protein DTO164E3_7879 [Paecilomyces variotii]KAJ9194639.1 hypothetical protein DTO032I3_7254 [Paecilomyces variotii]KAJ9220861.1 hypothetical protein DTO169C6_6806 [Paecilomyces variotii]KAJ9249359.1 hypothetical protein DTO207G8_6745 [Paecilomyces variotii]KAJ9275481.1 hypothetical protein DTO021D3_7664 [Paecilomyces variotii]
MSTTSDGPFYRSLPILVGYLLVCASLTGYIVHSLYSRLRYLRQHGQKRAEHRYIPLFATLAILSLGATWYHMFSFFAYSYRDWACRTGFVESTPLTARDLELWLKDTKLFREAWGAVVESPWRFWWSEQIFLWTTGWSLFLGISGRRNQIPHIWAYMLLGQIVAISFAQNLFYLAVLLYRPVPVDKRPSPHIWAYSVVIELLPLAISLFITALVPSTLSTPYFLFVLLVPHVVLFIPAIVNPEKAPKSLRSLHYSVEAATRWYISVFWVLSAVSSLLLSLSTFSALADNSPPPLRRARDSCALERSGESSGNPWERSLATIFEHPAVSSVSWDAIFCTIGFASWALVHSFYVRDMVWGPLETSNRDSERKQR